MLSAAFVSLVLAVAASASPASRPEPIKVSLQARQVPAGSIARRASATLGVPLTDFYSGTDLQWYGYLGIGTPPQNISVVFDTGSETLEFASTTCSSCTNQLRFDPSKSSTFVDGKRSSTITFGTGVGVDPVVGSNYQLTLDSATDTVAVGGLSVSKVSLYLITKQTSTFNIDPFSGIQGMSSQAQGLFAGLEKQGLQSLFGMFLAPNADGNAEMTLGGIDTTKFTGSLTYATLDSDSQPFWQITSSGITVNGQSTTALKKSRSFIFDSGTSNIVLPPTDTKAVYAAISSSIKPYSAEPGTYGIPCSQVSSLPAVIAFTFKSTSGSQFSLTIPSSELSVGPFKGQTTTCQTLINAVDGYYIIGASLLKHYYSVWDIGNQRMGFALNGL